MTPRAFKALYYGLLRVPMYVNGVAYKALRCPAGAALKVHLGPGQRNYLEGWVNVDANLVSSRPDLWADLRNPLPFRTGSVSLFYSHHVVEHLPDDHLKRHFSELFRALRSGGGIRVGVPHVGNACRKLVEGDAAWFSDFPDPHSSIGGRFKNFVFCRGEHLTAFDETYMKELLEASGFRDTRFLTPTKATGLADLGIDDTVLALEYESDFRTPHTLIVEARKP
jgi:predicted SAM-dependent methyltransferase